MALAELDDAPPWLQKGTPASISHSACHRTIYNGWEVIRDGLVTEVSVLSPGVKPAEPLAQLITFTRQESPPATTRADRPSVAGEVFYGGAVIRRNVGRVLAVR
jgi:hypothetical protein